MLSQVSRSLETVSQKRVQSNLAAATSILAGLVLNREKIKKILRSDIMRESVIYQDILEEGREEGALTAKLNSIPRLSVLGLSVEQIAQALDLEMEQVPQVIEGQN